MSGDEEEMEEGELIERMRARIGGNLMEEMDAAATNMDSPARREKVSCCCCRCSRRCEELE